MAEGADSKRESCSGLTCQADPISQVVCFLDYNDFFAYNFPPHDSLPAHLPRPILNEVEATRLIIMKIHVTKIEAPGPQDGQDLPVVHFEGISRSLDSSWDDNANSDLRGTTVKGIVLMGLSPRPHAETLMDADVACVP